MAVVVAALRGRRSLLAIGAIPVVLGIAYPVFMRSRVRRVDALLAELDRRQISDRAPDDH